MAKGLLERVSQLEAQLSGIVETVQGICRAVGAEEIQAKMAEIAREKMAAPIAATVKKGDLRSAEKVGPESLVVGVQWKKDGNVIFPGRFQIFVNDMVEEVRTKVIGMIPGGKLDLSDGGKLAIAEIYDKVTALDKEIDAISKVLDGDVKAVKPRKARKKAK